MFLWDWFSELLSYLGFHRKAGKILFLGLDNAGKTTLLGRLKDDKMAHYVPTLYATSEELTIGKLRLTAFDLGGHANARRIWKDYFFAVDGVVFIVDAFDRNRFLEAKVELDSLLDDEQISNCPVLILGNKIDRPGAASEEELGYFLGLRGRTTGKVNMTINELPGRPLELFMCSFHQRQGYGDGFRWLGQYFS